MKKILLLTMVALLCLTATETFAQEAEGERLRWRGIETNRFWDNWEISAGFGNSMMDVVTKAGKKNPGKFVDRNSWNANFAISKWFHPIVGVRLQLDGGQYQNNSLNEAVYGGDLYQTPYVFVHADAMLNLSNWIGGYREDRVYYAVPYAGMGYTAMSWTKNSIGSYNGEFAFTAGLLNKFRVCRQLDIQLDLRTWLLREQALPVEVRGSGGYGFAFSASVGVAYRFNRRDWSKAYSEVEVAGYVAALDDMGILLDDSNRRLEDANQRIGDLEAKNAELQKALDESRNAEANREEITPESVVFFRIGEATLSPYAKATLNNYIASLKGNDKIPFEIIGYADGETGSAARNEQLSMQRAEAVKAYMVKAGICADRITTRWVGSSVEAFDEPKTAIVNRCVIIR